VDLALAGQKSGVRSATHLCALRSVQCQPSQQCQISWNQHAAESVSLAIKKNLGGGVHEFVHLIPDANSTFHVMSCAPHWPAGVSAWRSRPGASRAAVQDALRRPAPSKAAAPAGTSQPSVAVMPADRQRPAHTVAHPDGGLPGPHAGDASKRSASHHAGGAPPVARHSDSARRPRRPRLCCPGDEAEQRPGPAVILQRRAAAAWAATRPRPPRLSASRSCSPCTTEPGRTWTPEWRIRSTHDSQYTERSQRSRG